MEWVRESEEIKRKLEERRREIEELPRSEQVSGPGS